MDKIYLVYITCVNEEEISRIKLCITNEINLSIIIRELNELKNRALQNINTISMSINDEMKNYRKELESSDSVVSFSDGEFNLDDISMLINTIKTNRSKDIDTLLRLKYKEVAKTICDKYRPAKELEMFIKLMDGYEFNIDFEYEEIPTINNIDKLTSILVSRGFECVVNDMLLN